MRDIKLDKKNKIAFAVVIGLLICIIFGASFNIYRNVKTLMGTSNKTNTPGITETNNSTVSENAGTYILGNNPTDFQKQIYDELIAKMEEYSANYTEELPFEICELVVKSFVADFFTWTNKSGNYDVGGLDYVYGPNHLNISMLARDGFYNDLDLYLKEYEASELLEVESISVESAYASPYVLDEEHVFNAAYYVRAKWTYKSGSVLDTSEFQNHGSFIVVYAEDRQRFEIVSLYEND